MAQQPTFLVFVYFIYGLAFFSMGLAVWLEVGRTPSFENVRALRFLAGFGVLHGLHEWVEAFIILHNSGVVELGEPFVTNILDVSLLLLSFLLLITFGGRMLFFEWAGNGRKQTLLILLTLFVLWGLTTTVALTIYKPCPEGCMEAADVLGRYFLGIPGALLAAVAMFKQRQSFLERGMVRCSNDIRWAAIIMFLYGVVGQLFTKQTPIFPSTVINSDLFFELFGFPVQIFRAVLASLVAIFVIRALRAFELERQRRFVAANEDKLAAQQEALEAQQQAQIETEKLNLELQTAVQNLTTLFDLSHSLAVTLDRDTILQQSFPQVCASMPRIARGIIFLCEGGERLLRPVVSYPPELKEENGKIDRLSHYVHDTAGPACWLNEKIIPLDPKEFQAGVHSPQRYGRAIGLPLIIKEQISGCLVITLHEDAKAASLNDLSLFCTIARQLSLAIENVTLYQEVQAREELRGELLHQVVTAQEMERQHIARELHDGIGQMLTALSLGLAAARDSITEDPERSFQQLDALKTMESRVLVELQNLISGLRPSVLDDLGLVPALRGLIQQFDKRGGLNVKLQVIGHQRRVQSEIETILFRIAQESLTNVVRHAQANKATVSLTFGPNNIALQVEDDGCGFDPDTVLKSKDKQHWGLLGIGERVSLVGGHSQIFAKPGAGTTISANIPLLEVPINV
jgi:signal transduction histidine kinase